MLQRVQGKLNVYDGVMTVPVDFNDYQYLETKDAGSVLKLNGRE